MYSKDMHSVFFFKKNFFYILQVSGFLLAQYGEHCRVTVSRLIYANNSQCDIVVGGVRLQMVSPEIKSPLSQSSMSDLEQVTIS